MQLTFEEARRTEEKMADGNHCSLYCCSYKHMGKKIREFYIYCNFESYWGKTWAAALKKLKSSIKK